MAEPTADSKPANPTEVARETLRRLALRKIAPTPDNYQALYEEIVGKPTAVETAAPDGAAAALSGLVTDLNLHHPELGEVADVLGDAVLKGDWARARKQLGLVSIRLKRGIEGTGDPHSEAAATLRELLAKTLELALAALLEHAPRLAEDARRLAGEVRTAQTATALREAASGLKTLWFHVDLNAAQQSDSQEMLKRILLLLVENIGELLDDDTWLRGQIDMVQEMLAGTPHVATLQDIEKRLKDVVYKQGLVKHSLREATATLKATMTTFVSRLSDAVVTSDEFQAKLAGHIQQISGTEDVLELNRILEDLLHDTRAAQTDTQRARDQLIRDRDAAQMAEARIRQLEGELAQMSALVREDPLTHSLNRRGLEEEFTREIARADRYQTAFSVAVLDVDNFKALNDLRGHQTGDEALVHLVKVAKEALRVTDHIARLGGEEFLILMPNTDIDEAQRTVARLQRTLTKRYFLHNNERVLITFSAGVAERAGDEAQDALVARADAAMYQAKQAGKNRVFKAAPAPTRTRE
jgi:diguanylate cyclase